MTISCIHITTPEAHDCLQTIVHYGCNSANGCISTRPDEACSVHEGTLNLYKSHFWARCNLHAICEIGNQTRFSVSVRNGIIGDTDVGPGVLPDRLNVE
jgi:hypothetical protein